MFYCERCRVINGFPQGIAPHYGPCEMCGNKAACWSVHSSQCKRPTQRKLVMTPAEKGDFSVDQLLGPKQMVVTKVLHREDRRAVVEFDEGDVNNPDSDPMIVGTIALYGDYVVRILWDQQLWRPVEDNVDQFLSMVKKRDRPVDHRLHRELPGTEGGEPHAEAESGHSG